MCFFLITVYAQKKNIIFQCALGTFSAQIEIFKRSHRIRNCKKLRIIFSFVNTYCMYTELTLFFVGKEDCSIIQGRLFFTQNYEINQSMCTLLYARQRECTVFKDLVHSRIL